ncbi:hypothetical protein KBX06_05870 [Micromonospora sp. C31]|uniref:hypothetical protein n=1 Tax=Micromonospora sp. C31 TaxID=2824876 RepID=UPI001B395A11|nr:hypothetical protein [Micromonospora sp. C31]MBQ1072695.1 hypothetical protein [Micromonospora sp. C31]
MELGRALLLILIFVAAASVPVVIALVSCADEIIDRFACAYAEWRERRRERRTIVRLDRAVAADELTRDIDLTGFDRPDRRPLEELAADLRRLRGQGVGSDGRQPIWHGMVLQAYDDRLRLACRALGLAEYLAELEGVDLELERVRVEGLLHAAGLTLPAARPGHRQRHR